MTTDENQYEIRKKYCPSRKKNVIIKVYFEQGPREECTERQGCEALGGCTNRYLRRETAENG